MSKITLVTGKFDPIHSGHLFYFKGSKTLGNNSLSLRENRNSTYVGTVLTNRISVQKLLTLVFLSGIRLTCSDNTPLTPQDGTAINSTEALGNYLPV